MPDDNSSNLDEALRRYLARQGRKGGQTTAARRTGNRFDSASAAAASRKRWARAQARSKRP
jgi:hypothetical protein